MPKTHVELAALEFVAHATRTPSAPAKARCSCRGVASSAERNEEAASSAERKEAAAAAAAAAEAAAAAAKTNCIAAGAITTERVLVVLVAVGVGQRLQGLVVEVNQLTELKSLPSVSWLF